jgi:hypothetical protein
VPHLLYDEPSIELYDMLLGGGAFFIKIYGIILKGTKDPSPTN